MKPLKSNPNRDNEKELAIKSRERFIELLNKHPNKLIKVDCLEFDKYGRLLVNAWNMLSLPDAWFSAPTSIVCFPEMAMIIYPYHVFIVLFRY
jgi:hypothetical protein